MHRSSALGLLAACAVTLLAQGTSYAQGSIFDQLAEPGEKVELRARSLEGGAPPSFHTEQAEDGSIVRFIGEGRIILRSSKLNLEANHFLYEAAEGVIRAEGDVVIDRPGVRATSDLMTYDLATEEIRLSGTPEVEQANDQNRTFFSGMDEFTIIKKETGETEVRMDGGEEIFCEILPPDAAAESSTPAPGPQAGTTTETESDGGFAGLGNNVKITTRPKNDEAPRVFVSTSPLGDFDLFRAEGSIVLQSDELDLRADLLEFDGSKQLVEALYNVYIKQEAVEADCGRMLYDLDKDQIVLSVSPFVREQSGGLVKTISEMDSFVITRHPDGTSSTHAIGGPDGEPRITWETKVDEAITPPADTGPIEIDLDSEEDIKKLTE